MTTTKRSGGNDDDKAAAADRAQRRAGQQAKIQWLKALGADSSVSAASARVGMVGALNHAYSKMSIRATRKHLAKLSGVSDSAVKRAIAELTEQYYWKVENTAGANIYTLIPPDERIELWDSEKRDWTNQCHRWAAAEKQWGYDRERWLEAELRHEWLTAESSARTEFVDKISAAIVARGGDRARATNAADNGWAKRKTWHASMDDVIASNVENWANMDDDSFLIKFNPDEVRRRVEARQEFAQQIYKAIYARCGNVDHSMAGANYAWKAHQDGLTLEDALEKIATRPQELFPAPDPEPEPAPEPPPASTHSDADSDPSVVGYDPSVGHRRPTSGPYTTHQWAKDESLNSGNEPSTSTSRTDKDAEVLQALASGPQKPGRARSKKEPTPAAAVVGRVSSRDLIVGCDFCNADGYALSLEDDPRVICILGDNEVVIEEYEFPCRHSLEDNKGEILRIMESSNGYWCPNWTGYGIEVDGEEWSEV